MNTFKTLSRIDIDDINELCDMALEITGSYEPERRQAERAWIATKRRQLLQLVREAKNQ